MIVPPATIGVLGGGQLGRYTVIAARLMGYGTIVLDPDPAAPAGADLQHLLDAYTRTSTQTAAEAMAHIDAALPKTSPEA